MAGDTYYHSTTLSVSKEEKARAQLLDAAAGAPEELLAAYEQAAAKKASKRVALARASSRRKIEAAKLDAAVNLAQAEFDTASKAEAEALSTILRKEGLSESAINPDGFFDLPGSFRPNDARRGPGRR